MSLALTIDSYPPSPADRYSYASTGVPTSSPPMDDGRCSLPSISDLFSSADIGSPSNIEQGAFSAERCDAGTFCSLTGVDT